MKTKLTLTVALCAVLVTTLFAQDVSPVRGKADVSIDVPSKVDVGDLIIVDVSKSKGKGFKFIILPEPKQSRLDSSGTVMYIGTGTKVKKYQIIVSCASGDESDVKMKYVTVRGVGGILNQSLTELICEACKDVQSDDPTGDALKLSQSFSTMSLDTDVQDVPSLMKKTKTSNQDALGENHQHWEGVRSQISAYLKALASAGKLKPADLEAHKAIWREVAGALAQFAKEA